MPKKTPGQYFLSKGISPSQLADRLEQLYPLEREVLLARASGETLRAIGGRLDLTPEGVRQVEIRALKKLREEDDTAQIQGRRFRLAVEQRLGVPLEKAVEGLPEPQPMLVLAYARGEPLADLAPTLGLSITEATALRDQAVACLLGEDRGSRAGKWAELKAAVAAALIESPLTYDDLEARFPMSRRRLMKLMQELVNEGRAELSDEYPFRFLGVKPPQRALD
ncbi:MULTISPECIES: sigma factor-like helix-turn-helix DNA-binding protein [Meiothermus]|jgi:DNA-directed RNA polymerase specialized sigma24 family protein|uniref:Sigma-70 region 4 domain protein n=2 Tax=Meiothermus ruber TaxID=277 RepID=D3PMU2_MEIRD|nr:MULTISPECIES: sigma factor-like helix-turn-helix DNA-binding protein [Meiothermus]ADD27267.1 sigma-70 region 4 domain protein [Meiothermus ruber DSM 1279]AGK03719.1 sigma-70 region 4 domain-containing protein [Meiothermus ruber DSM 1279]KIQ53828.1 sigma-70 protein [Meiothermus taiwanensis]MCL6530045.1 RNA polymerase subunit sigma-70 [Meiothermus ruber]GAO74192.1 sigma-70 region 4 domain-containing protein [Meiothermus ruber H328]